MRNFLRKAAGPAFILACVVAGIVVGLSLRSVSDAQAAATPADEWAASQGFSQVQPSECQAAVLEATLDSLGESTTGTWIWVSNIEASDDNAWGLAYWWLGRVVISNDVPCSHLASVVTHEWAHLVTPEAVHGSGYEELTADCVVARTAGLMGSDATIHTPYLDRAGDAGCSPEANQAALDILTTHGLLSVSAE